jgi:lysophospholipase L1-like esterase
MRWLTLLLCVLLFGCHRRDPTLTTTGTVPHIGEHESFLIRHEQFRAEGRAQKFDIICLGDSLTWGWDDHRELWKQEVSPLSTAFWAIGGDATNQLLWRIEHGELDGQAPKLIILLIGTNNRWVKDDADDIARSVDAVLQAITQKCPQAKVLLLGILPQGYGARDRSRLIFAEVNQKLPDVAKLRGAVFHDVGPALLEPDGSMSKEVSYDGTHLTEMGYRRLAKVLRKILNTLLTE